MYRRHDGVQFLHERADSHLVIDRHHHWSAGQPEQRHLDIGRHSSDVIDGHHGSGNERSPNSAPRPDQP